MEKVVNVNGTPMVERYAHELVNSINYFPRVMALETVHGSTNDAIGEFTFKAQLSRSYAHVLSVTLEQCQVPMLTKIIAHMGPTTHPQNESMLQPGSIVRLYRPADLSLVDSQGSVQNESGVYSSVGMVETVQDTFTLDDDTQEESESDFIPDVALGLRGRRLRNATALRIMPLTSTFSIGGARMQYPHNRNTERERAQGNGVVDPTAGELYEASVTLSEVVPVVGVRVEQLEDAHSGLQENWERPEQLAFGRWYKTGDRIRIDDDFITTVRPMMSSTSLDDELNQFLNKGVYECNADHYCLPVNENEMETYWTRVGAVSDIDVVPYFAMLHKPDVEGVICNATNDKSHKANVTYLLEQNKSLSELTCTLNRLGPNEAYHPGVQRINDGPTGLLMNNVMLQFKITYLEPLPAEDAYFEAQLL